MMPLALPLKIVLVAIVLAAAINDVHSRSIHKTWTVGGAICGLLLHTSLHGWAGLKTSLLGLAVGFALFLPLALLRGMSGGDVKLMAAVGSVCGPTNTIVVFILTAIAGGAFAIALLMWKGGLGRALHNAGVILGELLRLRAPYEAYPELSVGHERSVRLPYAVPIAIGSIAFLILLTR